MNMQIVETSFGKVSGVACGGAYEGLTWFKGIPYAAPPVGALRWRAPEDPKPWDGVRACDRFGDAPVQIFDHSRYYYEFYEHVGLPPMSEDCLYLNICTGAQSAEERRPVFLWFHGGGFTDCYAHEPHFDPRVLASKGVVVVTVGIRLGVFGYMALPQLSEEQGGHSGNYALMDQIKALDWVTANIAAFGGDPETITAGGQSHGATKAEALAVIPAARGRIRRVISQSGLRWNYGFASQEEMYRKSRNYLELAGVDPDTPLSRLREMDTYQIFHREIDRFSMPGTLTRDEITLPYDNMREAIEAGGGGIDFLSGCNLGEPVIFAESRAGFNRVPVREFVKKDRLDTAEEFYAYFENLLGPLYEKYHFRELVPVTDECAWDTARRLATLGLAGSAGPNVSRNLMVLRLFGRYMAKRSPESRTFSYLWSHIQPLSPDKAGTELDMSLHLAWHTSEFWFTFGSLAKGIPPHRPWREEDFRLAEIVTSYWANFIKTGDPNAEGLPFWPESGDHYGYLEITADPKGTDGLNGDLDRLCREFVMAEYKLSD